MATPTGNVDEPAVAGPSSVQAFASLSSLVDGRILRSLASQGFTQPTPIQSAVLPLAISENKDILARAKTGSGKTLSYAIPLVQKILSARSRLQDGYASADYLATRALVLVPTRELAEQISSHIRTLCDFFKDRDAIRVVNVAGASQSSKGKASQDKVQKLQLADRPDVVVATPSRALIHLRSQALSLEHLECLVIDEADLILSYGHSSDDIKSILSGGSSWTLPAVYQSFLMSATLTEEVDELKTVVLRNPVTVKLSDAESSSDGQRTKLAQYVVRTSEDDKFLLIYVILKLKLVKGKILIFVNDTDRGYRLKLFLEKFGIRAGVLNAELPFNSRYHAVQEFNRGVFNYLIATDESGLEGLDKDSDDEASDNEENGLISTQPMPTKASADGADGAEGEEDQEASTSNKRKATEAAQSSKKKRKQHGRSIQQTEYGVTRGIDFVDVACVINFDLPASARSYTHRIGRTARAGRSGMSLSFVVPKKQWGSSKQKGFETSLKSAKRDEKIWKRIEKDQKVNYGVPDDQVQEYVFDMKQVEGFRYRMEDGLRSVTRAYVREARIKEIKNEVLNSDKLKAHFEDNPRDLAYLKHDKPLNPNRVQKHMKHVPSYLMPRIAPVGGANVPGEDGAATGDGPSAANTGTGTTNLSNKYVPYRKPTTNNNKKGGRGGKFRSGKRGDPLKSFKRK